MYRPPRKEELWQETQVCEEQKCLLLQNRWKDLATCLVFLGIELNSNAMQIRLNIGEHEAISQPVACVIKSIQEAGAAIPSQLAHTSKVVCQGRTFLRCLIQTMETAKHSDHQVHLISTFQSNLIWSHTYLVDCNGVSMLWPRAYNVPLFILTSDALGSWGCGTLHNTLCFCVWKTVPSVIAGLHDTL